MRKYLLPLIFYPSISILILFSSGCATPMMKASPFYTGEIVFGVSSSGNMVKWNDPEATGIKKEVLNKATKRFDDERVNIWPLFYKNFLIYSIIWPIGEINDVGWEIRPLVSIDNYNESYKAMAYMWGYNGKAGSSYLFPAYYIDDGHLITMLGGWGEKFSYMVPPMFIRTKAQNGDDILMVMCPMSRFNLTTGESYVFPVYSKKNDSLCSLLFGWNKDMTYVIPPLYVNIHKEISDKPGEKENIYFVFWPFSGFNTTKGESFVFPVYMSFDDGFYSLLYGYGEKFLYFLPPCFIMGKHRVGNSYNFLWPLCSLMPSKNKYYSFPLFYYLDDKANEDFKFNYLFPLGWNWDNRNSSGSMFIPLYLDKTTKSNGEHLTLTPLFLSNNGFRDFMTPLFGWSNYGKDFYATPFFIKRSRHDYSDYSILLDLAKLRIMEKKEEGISAVQGHAIPFYSYYQDEDGYDLDIMFPLVASSSRGKGEGKIEYQRYLPFYYDYSDSEYSHTNYSFLGKIRKTINGSSHDAWYLFPFYYSRWDNVVHYELDNTPSEKGEKVDGQESGPIEKYKAVLNARKSTFIMPDILFSENKNTGEYDFSLVPFYFYSKDKNWISRSTFLWLFTQYENIEKKTVDTQALWFLYYYSRQDKTETEQERTSARILWKLYHRERLADEINFDIFPFISYSENQKRSRFSFCWRLFNYEKTTESSSLHLFFIPVMW